jgi:parallel beta-helix repeat protein
MPSDFQPILRKADMKRFNFLTAIVTLALMGGLITSGTSTAQAAVACGDQIVTDTKLEANLDCTDYVGDALVIYANNVTIDLNGYTIMNENTEYAAIFGDGFSGITIKNGAISGFFEGVYLFNAKNVVVEQLTIRGQGDDSIQINYSKDVKITDVYTSLPLPNAGSSIALQFVHDANLDNINANGGFLGVLSHDSSNFSVVNSRFSNVRNMGVRIVKNQRAVVENVSIVGASTCDSAIGVVWLGPSEQIYILNNVVSGCGVGVLGQTELPSQIHIRDNQIYANADGILLFELMDSDVRGNRVHFNDAGIVLLEGSYNNKIAGNVATGNRDWDIYHDESSYPNVWKNNTCASTNKDDVDCP